VPSVYMLLASEHKTEPTAEPPPQLETTH
jgi:hypothetical protein